MVLRIETKDGVFIDGRLIPVVLVGLFEDWGSRLRGGAGPAARTAAAVPLTPPGAVA
ncbi:MAG TPA: hypothetical protein VLK28_03100 [Methylomirabilota bacterium]|nr:hypothetical protein [Methylomirabilota bacterium]